MSEATKDATTTQLEAGVPFVSAEQAEAAALDAGLDPAEVDPLIESYEDSQLEAHFEHLAKALQGSCGGPGC